MQWWLYNHSLTANACPFHSDIHCCVLVSQILSVGTIPPSPLASSELSLDNAKQLTFSKKSVQIHLFHWLTSLACPSSVLTGWSSFMDLQPAVKLNAINGVNMSTFWLLSRNSFQFMMIDDRWTMKQGEGKQPRYKSERHYFRRPKLSWKMPFILFQIPKWQWTTQKEKNKQIGYSSFR